MVSFRFTAFALLGSGFVQTIFALPELSVNKPTLHRRTLVNDALIQTAHNGAVNLQNVNPQTLHQTIPLPQAIHPQSFGPEHQAAVETANEHQRAAVAAHNAGDHKQRFKSQSKYHDAVSGIHTARISGHTPNSPQHINEVVEGMKHVACAMAAKGAAKHVDGKHAKASDNYGRASEAHDRAEAVQQRTRRPLGELSTNEH